MDKGEQRAFVRGRFIFRINFRVLDEEESSGISFDPMEKSSFSNSLVPALKGLTTSEAESTADPMFLQFILHMDEKLDRLLRLVEKDQGLNPEYHPGTGLDISASGMRFSTNIQLQKGQIIHTTFVLFQKRFVFVDVFARVVQVCGKSPKRADEQIYGVEFLNLKHDERERIISAVFEKEREMIRQMKSES